MMSLILWRHAKSSWDEAGLADHDRPLNGRGRRAAPVMAAYLADNGLIPKQVLCSTSLRTRETLAALLTHLRRDAVIALTRDIYEADASDLLAMIRDQPAGATPLMVIGHNPTFEDLAHALVSPAPLAPPASGSAFPTAAAAHITFSCDRWADIAPGTGTLESLTRPRDLMG